MTCYPDENLFARFQVNPAGPLSNLKKLFLDGEIVNTVKEFLTKHWYVGVAAALGFVIIIVSNRLSVCLSVCLSNTVKEFLAQNWYVGVAAAQGHNHCK